MQEMFKRCSSLTSLDLISFNTSNVTDIYLFGFCKYKRNKSKNTFVIPADTIYFGISTDKLNYVE